MFIKVKKTISLSFFKGYLLGLIFFLYIKIRLLILLIFLLCIFSTVNAGCLFEDFPSFSFESHDGTLINKDCIKNMDIEIIIYGTPEALSNNRKQLDSVLEFLKSADKANIILYTINFSSYPRLIRGIIKNQMQNNSQELGINIYADWDGLYKKHFELDTKKVSFFLLDNDGLICKKFYFQDATDTLSKINENTSW